MTISYRKIYQIIRKNGPIDINGISDIVNKDKDITHRQQIVGYITNLSQNGQIRKVPGQTKKEPAMWVSAIDIDDAITFLKNSGLEYYIYRKNEKGGFPIKTYQSENFDVNLFF